MESRSHSGAHFFNRLIGALRLERIAKNLRGLGPSYDPQESAALRRTRAIHCSPSGDIRPERSH